jgi:hypothetical protein
MIFLLVMMMPLYMLTHYRDERSKTESRSVLFGLGSEPEFRSLRSD